MRFMMLVKATKDFEAGVLPDEKLLSEMAKWTEELVKAGARLEAGRLQPSSQGVRVRYANGKFTVTDGPFAETKELIAGFCLIQAKSTDEAIEWAKRVPFEEGEIELRPLYELFDFPVDAAEKPDGWREQEEQLRAAPPARKPGTIRYMAIVKADKDTEAGVLPDEKALADHGSVHGGRGEVRRVPLGRGAAAKLEGRACPVLRKQAHGDRRTLRGNEGAGRRLCDPPVHVEGPGDRVDQALRAGRRPASPWRRERVRDPPLLRVRGLRSERGDRTLSRDGSGEEEVVVAITGRLEGGCVLSRANRALDLNPPLTPHRAAQ